MNQQNSETRQRFEQWARHKRGRFSESFTRRENDEYLLQPIQHLWEAFQAGGTGQAAPTPTITSEEAHLPDIVEFTEGKTDKIVAIVGGFEFSAASRREAAQRLRSYLLRQIGKLHTYDTEEDAKKQLTNILHALKAEAAPTPPQDAPKTLTEAVNEARTDWQSRHGKCTMCAIGDVPVEGFHRGIHECGNAGASSGAQPRAPQPAPGELSRCADRLCELMDYYKRNHLQIDSYVDSELNLIALSLRATAGEQGGENG